MKKLSTIPSVRGTRNPTEAELAMIAAGLDYADVGRAVMLSPFTVRRYCREGCNSERAGRRLSRVLGISEEFFIDKHPHRGRTDRREKRRKTSLPKRQLRKAA